MNTLFQASSGPSTSTPAASNAAALARDGSPPEQQPKNAPVAPLKGTIGDENEMNESVETNPDPITGSGDEQALADTLVIDEEADVEGRNEALAIHEQMEKDLILVHDDDELPHTTFNAVGGALDINTVFLAKTRKAFVGKVDGSYTEIGGWPRQQLIHTDIALARRYRLWLEAIINTDDFGRLESTIHFDVELTRAGVEKLIEHLRTNGEDPTQKGKLVYWINHVEVQLEMKKKAEKAFRIPKVKKPTENLDKSSPSQQPSDVSQEPTEQEVAAEAVQKNIDEFAAHREKSSEEISSLEKELDALKADELLKGIRKIGTGTCHEWTGRLTDPFSANTACPVCGESRHHLIGKPCLLLKKADPAPKTDDEDLDDGSIEAVMRNLVKADPSLSSATNDVQCTYRLCKGQGHTVAACPTLHHRCTKCGHRGHMEDTTMMGKLVCTAAPTQLRNTDYNVVNLGAIFELFANQGTFTKTRHSNVGAGYHNCRSDLEIVLAQTIGPTALRLAPAEKIDNFFATVRKEAAGTFNTSTITKAGDTRFGRTGEEDQALYDSFVENYRGVHNKLQATIIDRLHTEFEGREHFSRLVPKTAAGTQKACRDQVKKAEEESRRVFDEHLYPLLAGPHRAIIGQEPTTTLQELEFIIGKATSAMIDLKNRYEGSLKNLPPPKTATPFANALKRPATPSTLTTSATKPVKKGSTTSVSSDTSSPAAKKAAPSKGGDQKKDRRTTVQGGATNLSKELVEAGKAAYTAARLHRSANGPAPSNNQQSYVKLAEFDGLSDKVKALVGTAVNGVPSYQLTTTYTKAEMDTIPTSLVFWPKTSVKRVWGHTPFKDFDVALIAGNIWLVLGSDKLYRHSITDPAAKPVVNTPKK